MIVEDVECKPLTAAELPDGELSPAQKISFEEAFSMQEKNEFFKAQVILEALAKQKASFAVNFNLGLLYARGGKLEKAEAAFKESSKLHPRFRPNFKMLAAISDALGKSDESHYYRSELKRL